MKICKIGDICNVNPSSYSDNEGWSYAYYLDTSNITENVINTIQYFDLKKEKLPSRARRIVEMGDIIYSTVRPDQRHYGFITHTHRNFLVSTGFTTIRAKEDVCDSKYLYYFLTQEKIILYLQSLAEQAVSTFPSIRSKDIEELIIPLPPLPVQKKIAAILSSLDDKIEINTRMNKVLEETARALFHRWFVEFEFPNDEGKPYKSSGGRMIASEMGEIPEGWRVGTVGDVVQIFGGSTPNTKNLDYWENGEHPFCTPKDLSTLSTSILLDTERHITDKGVQTISSKQLPPGTLLLSSRAPVGYLAISAVPISVNQGFIAMVCNETISNVYVLQWIQENMDEIKGRANGSTFLEISKRNFRGIPFLIPAEPVLSSYNRSVKPLYDFVENIVKENVRLRTLRDELLSKLMAS